MEIKRERAKRITSDRHFKLERASEEKNYSKGVNLSRDSNNLEKICNPTPACLNIQNKL